MYPVHLNTSAKTDARTKGRHNPYIAESSFDELSEIAGCISSGVGGSGTVHASRIFEIGVHSLTVHHYHLHGRVIFQPHYRR